MKYLVAFYGMYCQDLAFQQLINLLSRRIGDLSDDTIDWIIHEIETGSAGRE